MISKQEYKKRVDKASENSPILKNCVWAFVSGGLICVLGQGLIALYIYFGLSEEMSKTLTSVSLIFLGAMLTGFGVFHKIAKHTGAGTAVPITGFANSVASSAAEFKSEGWLMGVGAKMFIIAGPVIVYGILSSCIYGIVLFLINLAH